VQQSNGRSRPSGHRPHVASFGRGEARRGETCFWLNNSTQRNGPTYCVDSDRDSGTWRWWTIGGGIPTSTVRTEPSTRPARNKNCCSSIASCRVGLGEANRCLRIAGWLVCPSPDTMLLYLQRASRPNNAPATYVLADAMPAIGVSLLFISYWDGSKASALSRWRIHRRMKERWNMERQTILSD